MGGVWSAGWIGICHTGLQAACEQEHLRTTHTLTTGWNMPHSTGNETYQQIRWNHTCKFS